MSTINSASVRVGIPPALLGRTGNRRWVHVSGETVRDVINGLEAEYPGLRFNICHETGELRPYVNIFVGGEEVRFLDGLDTPVPSGTTIHVIHSVAGGESLRLGTGGHFMTTAYPSGTTLLLAGTKRGLFLLTSEDRKDWKVDTQPLEGTPASSMRSTIPARGACLRLTTATSSGSSCVTATTWARPGRSRRRASNFRTRVA